MTITFTKLVSTLTDSSIWDEPDSVRVIWVTMLAMADQNGEIMASIPGLANRARKTIPEVEAALELFRSPDKYSRTKDLDGRRIEDIDGGWRLINYQKYRDSRDEETKRAADRERQRRHREKLSHSVTPCHAVSQEVSQAEAEAEADIESGGRDEQILEIGHTHPANEHLKDRDLPYIQLSAIGEAIERDGFELVMAGTRNLRDAVSRWPISDRRFIPNPAKFYTDSEYLKDPHTWERGNNAQGNGRKLTVQERTAELIRNTHVGPDFLG